MTTRKKESFFFDNDPNWTLEAGISRSVVDSVSTIANTLIRAATGSERSEEEVEQEAWQYAIETLKILTQSQGPLAENMIQTFLEQAEDGTLEVGVLAVMEIALALFVDAKNALQEGRLNFAINCYAQGKLFLGIGKGEMTGRWHVKELSKEHLSQIAKARHQQSRNAKEGQRQAIINLWKGGHPTEQRGWRTITEAAEFAANHLPGVKFRTAQKWISEASKKP